MGIGTSVRHRLGRFEVPAAELYRSCFINLDALGERLSTLADPKRILEIGCGDGALGQRLTQVFAQADYLGIDPQPTAGRLYRGDPTRAVFRSQTSTELAAQSPDPFDLVVIVDVLHHIPAPIRTGVLRDAATLCAPDGIIIVKEWLRGRPVFGHLAYWADRYVTGDKDVDFMTGEQLTNLLETTLPEFTLKAEGTVAPWRENILLSAHRTGDHVNDQERV